MRVSAGERLIDIKPRMRDKDIISLLACCVGNPTEDKLIKTAEEDQQNANRFIMGYEPNGSILGFAGIEIIAPGQAVLLHIAVDPACRGQGIGKSMIGDIIRQFVLQRLEAETDDDAVGFYKNCGFEITCLGEKYPGCVRYLCVKLIEYRVGQSPTPI
jgi:ribosomal protein S18 acetylase RimI-like enzyme